MQFRTSNGRIKYESSEPISEARLAGVDLAGIVIFEQDLRGANFTGALLTGAVFFNSDLRDVSFDDAVLEGAAFYFVESGRRKI